MGILERARLYLLRKKARVLILLVILTVISTLVSLCVSIGNASNRAIQTLRETMGGYFKVEVNEKQGYSEPVNDDMIRKILNTGGIKAYNGMDLTYLMVDQLTLEPGKFTMEGDNKAYLARFLGNTDSSLNEYFILRSFSLKEGRHISSQDFGKAVISDSLAQKNHLSVGDSFTVSYDMKEIPDEQKGPVNSHSLQIVGIFQIDALQDSGGENRAECDMAENFIFTDTAFIRAVIGEAANKKIEAYSNGCLFFVENPKKMNGILSRISDISDYDWNGYLITENNKTYQESAASLEHLSGLITTLVIIIVVISMLLLSLILFLWMRERIYEIGIYMSIGIRKSRIIGQHLLENLIIAFMAFLLTGIIASVAINTVETEIQKSLEIHMGILEFMEIWGIEVLIVAVSTGIVSGLVLRMRPKDIFSTMS